MSRQKRPSTITAEAVDSQVLKFVSRAEQLRLRGQRNYSRYMFVVKGLVDPDGPERAQWHEESAQESMRDAEWKQRHGPISGGASILQWRQSQLEYQTVEASGAMRRSVQTTEAVDPP